MSFATLEEAWGVPGFSNPARPVADASRDAHRDASRDAHRHGDFAPAPQLLPRAEADDAAAEEARRVLARAYARHGVAGVLRLLPSDAAARLGPGRGDGLWADVADFVSCPEKVLFVLLCAFALLVVWDGWHASQAARNAVASLQSLQMTPTLQTFTL